MKLQITNLKKSQVTIQAHGQPSIVIAAGETHTLSALEQETHKDGLVAARDAGFISITETDGKEEPKKAQTPPPQDPPKSPEQTEETTPSDEGGQEESKEQDEKPAAKPSGNKPKPGQKNK